MLTRRLHLIGYLAVSQLIAANNPATANKLVKMVQLRMPVPCDRLYDLWEV